MEKDEMPEDARRADDPSPPERDAHTRPNPEGGASDLPPERAACEPAIISGDGLTTKRVPDIECECTPISAGAAVPALSIDGLEPGITSNQSGTDHQTKSDETTTEVNRKPDEMKATSAVVPEPGMISNQNDTDDQTKPNEITTEVNSKPEEIKASSAVVPEPGIISNQNGTHDQIKPDEAIMEVNSKPDEIKTTSAVVPEPGIIAISNQSAIDDETKPDEATTEVNSKPDEIKTTGAVLPDASPHNPETDPICDINTKVLKNAEVTTSSDLGPDKLTNSAKPKPCINSQGSLLSMDSSCNELFEKLHMLIKNTVVKDIVNAALDETGCGGARKRDVSHLASVSTSRPSQIPKPRRPSSAQKDAMEKLQEKLNIMKCSSKPPPIRIKQSKTVKTADASSGFSPVRSAPSKPVSKTASSFSAGKTHVAASKSLPTTSKKVPAAEIHSFSPGKSPFLGVPPKPVDSKRKLQKPPSAPKAKESKKEPPMTPPEKIDRLITQMQHVINDNFAKTHWKSQRDNINKLVTNLHEIKTLIDTSFVEKDLNTRDDTCSQTDDVPQYFLKKDNIAPLKPNKAKSNKVYIKFVQSNDKADKRDSSDRLCELVKLTPEEEEAKIENRVKDADSMDGVFIPTCEPPANIEEEEEESNGLDITITFPQITRLVSDEVESKLAVSLSDISEGALRRLKRCPKDFTLHMDFVQGKVQFQSGTTTVNNFSIGPDLRFVENPIDEKRSEVINIKPSTECKFTSQQVSLENVERTSHKSLKSTDSELFNVVNLPCVYRNSSLNTVTRSCTTFRSDVFSASMAKQLFKSTPQIPSLDDIFEDKLYDNANKAALPSTDKKRKGRNVQKKMITSNTTL